MNPVLAGSSRFWHGASHILLAVHNQIPVCVIRDYRALCFFKMEKWVYHWFCQLFLTLTFVVLFAVYGRGFEEQSKYWIFYRWVQAVLFVGADQTFYVDSKSQKLIYLSLCICIFVYEQIVLKLFWNFTPFKLVAFTYALVTEQLFSWAIYWHPKMYVIFQREEDQEVEKLFLPKEGYCLWLLMHTWMVSTCI